MTIIIKKRTQIRSFVELQLACNEESPRDFFILLGNGSMRSSKSIQLRPKRKSFYVLNEIDDTRQVLNEKSLFTRSNIGEAMTKGAFFTY